MSLNIGLLLFLVLASLILLGDRARDLVGRKTDARKQMLKAD